MTEPREDSPLLGRLYSEMCDLSNKVEDKTADANNATIGAALLCAATFAVAGYKTRSAFLDECRAAYDRAIRNDPGEQA